MLCTPADACQIIITGAWVVVRQENSNSFNSFGVERTGRTETDLGARDMDPWLLNYTSPQATYVIQGSAVERWCPRYTFSDLCVFLRRLTETATTDNSNYMFQSNTVATPTWVYWYQRQWQIPDDSLDLLQRVAQFRNTRS